MPRCNSCERMRGYDAGEPDASGLEVTLTLNDKVLSAEISGTITITATCDECGDDLRTAEVEVNETLELPLGDVSELGVALIGEALDNAGAELDTDGVTTELTRLGKKKVAALHTSGEITVTFGNFTLGTITVDDTTACGEMEECW